jgi:hypothetical protein
MRRLLPILILLALVPATASAVTIKEIVSLSKAGVSDQVILALIDRDGTIFRLPADEIVTLQKEGVSDAIVLAMLHSGRNEPLPTAPVAAPQPDPEPDVIVVGHGPDRPNVGMNDGNSSAGGVADPYAVQYFVPAPYVVPGTSARAQCGVRSTPTRADAATGVFFLNQVPSLFFPNQQPAVRVTACPPTAPRRASQRR